jgi:phosphonate transport system permease protein
VSSADSSNLAPERKWEREHFIRNPWLRWGLSIGIITYLVYASSAVNLDFARIMRGLPRAADFIGRMFPPDYSIADIIFNGTVESLQIAIISTFVGTILAIPVAVAGSANIAPKPVYALARLFIIVARSFPPVLVAILFVKAFGFGPFAGILTLIFVSMGFIGKLLAEAIENIDKGQIEAVQATGANWFKVMLYGVAPQVMPRYVGLTIYRLDINLRASTIIGIVGAGGIGGALFNSFQRYEYDISLAILIVIIVLVLIAEWASGKIRSRIQ